MTFSELLGALATGMIGGFFSGMLGVSSGGLLVPLGVLLLQLDQHAAQGLSLAAQVFPTSLSGFYHYKNKGHGIASTTIGIVAAGFVVGGVVGALSARNIANQALQWTFVAYLLLFASILLVPSRAVLPGSVEYSQTESKQRVLTLCVIGFAAGFSSGFLGIGGGLALSVLAIAMLAIPQHQAQALSLAVTALPLTFPAAWSYVRLGYDLPVAAVGGIVLGLWLGMPLGAKVAIHMEARALKGYLIALVVLMAGLMAWRAAS